MALRAAPGALAPLACASEKRKRRVSWLFGSSEVPRREKISATSGADRARTAAQSGNWIFLDLPTWPVRKREKSLVNRNATPRNASPSERPEVSTAHPTPRTTPRTVQKAAPKVSARTKLAQSATTRTSVPFFHAMLRFLRNSYSRLGASSHYEYESSKPDYSPRAVSTRDDDSFGVANALLGRSDASWGRVSGVSFHNELLPGTLFRDFPRSTTPLPPQASSLAERSRRRTHRSAPSSRPSQPSASPPSSTARRESPTSSPTSGQTPRTSRSAWKSTPSATSS